VKVSDHEDLKHLHLTFFSFRSLHVRQTDRRTSTGVEMQKQSTKRTHDLDKVKIKQNKKTKLSKVRM